MRAYARAFCAARRRAERRVLIFRWTRMVLVSLLASACQGRACGWLTRGAQCPRGTERRPVASWAFPTGIGGLCAACRVWCGSLVTAFFAWFAQALRAWWDLLCLARWPCWPCCCFGRAPGRLKEKSGRTAASMPVPAGRARQAGVQACGFSPAARNEEDLLSLWTK